MHNMWAKGIKKIGSRNLTENYFGYITDQIYKMEEYLLSYRYFYNRI